jgi:hypothetical protein
VYMSRQKSRNFFGKAGDITGPLVVCHVSGFRASKLVGIIVVVTDSFAGGTNAYLYQLHEEEYGAMFGAKRGDIFLAWE